jgi:hypothetical protein
MKTKGEQYSEKEVERRAKEAIARSFMMPYKLQKELVGKTPRASARKRNAAKDPPKSP